MIRQFELVERVQSYDPDADEDVLNRAYVYAAEEARHPAARLGRPLFLASRRGRRHPGRDAARHRLDRHRPAARHGRGHRRHARRDRSACSARRSPGWSTASPSCRASSCSRTSTKQAENFRKLVLAMSSDIRVLLVKLADRLHNMRTLHHIKDPAQRRRIARETHGHLRPARRAHRHGAGQATSSRTWPSPSSIRTAAPRSSARSSFLREQRRAARAAASIAELVKHAEGRRARGAGLGPREDALFDLAQDAAQERRRSSSSPTSWPSASSSTTSPQCYQALGVLHAPLSRCCRGRFKDYISTPKPNGYRSLHTGVIGPRGQRIEIQIRTERDARDRPSAASPRTGSTSRAARRTDGRQYAWLREPARHPRARRPAPRSSSSTPSSRCSRTRCSASRPRAS